MAEVLDYVVRNQVWLIFLLVGFIAGCLRNYLTKPVMYLFDFVRRKLSQIPTQDAQQRVQIERMIKAQISIVVAVLGITLGASKPIPATTKLELPPLLSEHPTSKALVLFLHGWNGDQQLTWNKFPGLLQTDHRLQDVDILVVSYPTFMARRNLRIAGLADWLNQSFKSRPSMEKYERIVVIAHSMGGLIARQVVLLQQLDGGDRRLGLLIEIGTPHLGADPSSIAIALGISRELTQEMQQGSSFLTTLRTQWQRFRERPRTQAFTSPQDRVVSEESAIFQCDEWVSYPQWSHTELVKPEDRDDSRYDLPVSELLKHLETSLSSAH